jgi:3-phenylpropionate/trans-cinnamate dioxygenase ferredoxin component
MAGEWIDVGDLKAVEASQPFPTEVDGMPVVIVRCEAGYYAIEDRCTHDGEALAGGEVDTHACEVICPRHGARFCLKTGDALSPPAYEPVSTFAVRVEDGRVKVQIP